MADWELIITGDDTTKKAQCPYCDFIVSFRDVLPEKCPDCSRKLEYERACPYYKGDKAKPMMCKKRGCCHICDIFLNRSLDEGVNDNG